MTMQKGRDLLLKIGDGEESESFSTIAAVRLVSLNINNNPVDTTSMNSGGIQALQAGAGVQTMEIYIQGLFKDTTAEEALRTTAFGRTSKNYELLFPNGDKIAAAFAVTSYQRDGSHEGLETFSCRLIRSGSSTFTPGG